MSGLFHKLLPNGCLYKESISYFRSAPNKADLPSVDAENLRRDKRWKTGGTIGTYTNQRKMLEDAKENFQEIGPQILDLLREITPEGQLDGEIPAELRDILDLLAHLDRPLESVGFKLYTPEELREIRSGLSDVIEKMHLLLYKYYKNDQRLHFEVMNVISIANNAIRDADERYEELFIDGKVGGGDLGTLRNDTMQKKQKFSLQDGSASVELSPSLFEGWMQIYKTPKAAIEAVSRYEKLNKKARTDAEEKEFGKLTRKYSLAKDFSRSHRYMMEKDKFSDQDMDYAFAMEKKEKDGLSDESLSGGKTSAAVYQSLILEQGLQRHERTGQRIHKAKGY